MTPYGILDVGPWQAVAAALILTHITIIAVTVFLHRAQAHRALDLHPWVSHFFRFWLWLTTSMVTKEWVAIHRKHHAKCETPDDWVERNIYSRYQWQGLGLMLVLDLLLFGVYGITIWAVQMLWIPVWAAGVINGVGHWFGYRNYESRDASTNIVPWGILIGGEELHNNHHAFPSSARLSSKWWEFDIGWFYIRTLALLGLAKVKKVAPEPHIIPGKSAIDMETLKAVIVGRMHVFARYAREVMEPVTRAELCRSQAHCRRVARRATRLLVLEGARVDAGARAKLEQLLAQSQQLATVYQYRERLREIWERTAPSQEALLKSLQDWCQQAEATGIQALQTFARNLRGYSLQSGGSAH